MISHEYLTVFASTSEEFTRKLNVAATAGYEVNSFKYVEYPVSIKGEGHSAIQSYVAIMKRVQATGS